MTVDDDSRLRNIIDTDLCIIDRNSSCEEQDSAYEMVFVPISQVWAVKIQDTNAANPNQCFLQVNNATYQNLGNNTLILDEPLSIVMVTGGC